MGRFAWPAAFVAIAAMTFSHLKTPAIEPRTSEVVVEHPGATVVKEIRALGRLESASLHLEKVIQVKDRQTHLYGMIEAEDSVLFVATGEVVLGVDLAKLGAEDVRFDAKTGTATIDLPPIEVLTSRFDEPKSYVHARTTDALAKRNEGLEGRARKEAIAAFELAGRDAAAQARAREAAEKQLKALLVAGGVKDVVFTWKVPRGEVDLATR